MQSAAPLLTLRRAVPGDADRLATIQARAVRSGAPGFYGEPVIEAWAWGQQKAAACRGWIADPVVQVMICDYEAIPLGFAIYVANSDAVYLHSLYCDPPAMRRGIGRSLLAHVEASAAERAKTRVTVQSSLNAISFYEAHGFTRMAPGFQEIGPARLRWDYVAMAKRLSA